MNPCLIQTSPQTYLLNFYNEKSATEIKAYILIQQTRMIEDIHKKGTST